MESPERHQPLPPITRLPRLLWDMTPGPGKVAIVVLALGVLGAAVLLAPVIRDAKRDTAARERREAAEARAQRVRELEELQRPRTARTSNTAPTDAAPARQVRARRLLMRDLEAKIAADARSRRDGRGVLRVDCLGLAPDGGRGTPETDLPARRGRYSCTAVTSDIETEAGRGAIGFPFRALVDFQTGSMTFCRIAGRPGEGSFTRRSLVSIPKRCGG